MLKTIKKVSMVDRETQSSDINIHGKEKHN